MQLVIITSVIVMEEEEDLEVEQSPPPPAMRFHLKRRHISWTSHRVLTSVAMEYAEITLGMRGVARNVEHMKYRGRDINEKLPFIFKDNRSETNA